MKRYRIAVGVVLTAAVLLLLPSANALAAARPSVSLKAAAKTVTVGQTLSLKGTVGHPRSGARSVTILERVGTKWQKLATAKLSSKHTYKVTVKLTKVGTWRLEAQYKAGSTKVHSKVVVITVNGWAYVSCGFAHTMALKTDGTLWAWGDNDNGQLGLGSTAEKNSPTQVDPGSTWKAVSCGYDYTLAIKSNGSLWAWGDNGDGQLGLGSTAQKNKPTEVDPGSTWTAVSAGYDDTLAIQSNGTLWGWGDNGDGELGLNNENETNSPTQVGSLDTWTAVSSGYGYTMAIQSNASLWGSGDNLRGELGLGASDGTETFTHVGADTWTTAAVSGTDWYTLALEKRRHPLGLRPQRRLPARPGRHQRQKHPHSGRHGQHLADRLGRLRLQPGRHERRRPLGLGLHDLRQSRPGPHGRNRHRADPGRHRQRLGERLLRLPADHGPQKRRHAVGLRRQLLGLSRLGQHHR